MKHPRQIQHPVIDLKMKIVNDLKLKLISQKAPD